MVQPLHRQAKVTVGPSFFREGGGAITSGSTEKSVGTTEMKDRTLKT